jgi:hypothetical protein
MDGSSGFMISDERLEELMNRTDEEIEAAAADDPDNPILTDEQLKQFKRVDPLTDAQHISILKNNVRELQEQLQEAYKRIKELTDA